MDVEDLVIVGAGVAGLTLAWRLAELGLACRVFEARARSGGRTDAFDFAGTSFDVGATWVWQTEDAVMGLIDELGLRTFASHRGGVDLYDSADGVQRVRLPPSSVPEFRIEGGAASIARNLASRVDVELERRVTRVEGCSEGVRVVLEDGEVLARRVVLAVPPALAADLLDDDPDCPSDLLRSVPVWMGDMAKVVAVYEEPFWLEEGLSGRVFSHRGPMVEVHDISGRERREAPALFGFVPRSFAREGWREAVVQQLGRLFGDRGMRPLHLEIRPWWEERETSPANTVTADHQLMGQALLRRPFLNGQVFLGSTETAVRGAGHIDGAVRRAEELAAYFASQ